MKKPLIKKFYSESWLTQIMNKDDSAKKWVSVDWKAYAKALEKYIAHLEKTKP